MRYSKSLLLMFALLVVPQLPGQSIARADQQSQAASISARPSLQSRITINLEATPFVQAIEAVARQAELNITIARGARLDKRITLRLRDVTAGDAFRALLEGTGVQMGFTSEGQILFSMATGRGARTAQGSVAGKVVDGKTGKGISGATVSVDGDTRGVISDEDGSYHLTGISAGSHVITVRLLGYAKQNRQVTIGNNATVTVDFKLEPTANILDQVVVTGTIAATELKAVPNAMTIITAKQIEERGITRIEQLFRGDVPGLYAMNVMGGSVTDNYGQVALFSRGATAIDNTQASGSTGINAFGPLTNNMKMYVDGVQLSDSGLKFLGQIDPKSIERMEILTGPQASTVYGAGAINGVIQIFTKRGTTSRPKFNLSFQSGMAESNYKKGLELNNYVTNASLSGLEGRISYRIGTSWNHDASWLSGTQTNGFGGDGSTHISLGSKITADASARWSRRYSHVKGAPGRTVPFGALQADGVQSQTFGSGIVNETAFTGSQSGGLTLNYTQFPWWSHSATFGFDGNTYGRYQPQPKYANRTDTSLSLTYRPGSNMSQRYNSTMQLPLLSLASLNLTFGGDHSRTDVGNLGWGTNQITGKILSVPNSFSEGLFTVTKPNKHSGAYVQGRLGIKDALFFTYGLRTSWDPAYGDKADVKPDRYGVAFNQDFGPVTAKLRGTYGRSIRAPKRDLTKGFLIGANQEFEIQQYGVYYRILPNPELVPEDQRGGEGGIDLYIGNRGSLSVTRYNQTTDNLIQGFGSDSVRSLRINEEFIGDLIGFPITCDELIDLTGGDFPCGYQYQKQYKNLNVGSIRNQGWELAGTMNLGPINTTGSYSWTKSRILGITPKYKNQLIDWAGDRFQVGAPFQYFPEHTWAFGMTYNNSTSMISLNVNGHGTNLIPVGSTILGLTTSSNNRLTYTRDRAGLPSGVASLAVPGYSNAYLTANHRFSSRINATLHVDNLTNHYANDYNMSFPSQGRVTKLGANVSW